MHILPFFQGNTPKYIYRHSALLSRLSAFLFDFFLLGSLYFFTSFYLETQASLLQKNSLYALSLLLYFAGIPSLFKGTCGQILWDIRDIKANGDYTCFKDYFLKCIIITFPFIICHSLYWIQTYNEIVNLSSLYALWNDIGYYWMFLCFLSPMLSPNHTSLPSYLSNMLLIEYSTQRQYTS